MEKEVLSSSPWDALTGCVGMVQSCTRGGLDDIKKHFFTQSVVKQWNRLFPERWLMSQTHQCLRGTWMMPLLNTML